jgi:cytoskeletal protein RodZ
MKTKTIGEILKEEREFHRFSIEDLSQRTRIRQEYLEALEANQFSQLPSATFVRGYIRTYGQIFGFEYQPLLGLLRRDYKESARGQLIPREYLRPILKRRVVWTPAFLTMLVVATVAVSMMGFVGWQWYLLNRPPLLEIIEPTANAEVSAQVIVKGVSSPEAVVTVNSQPVSLQSDGDFQTLVQLPREGVNTITIEAIDRRGKSSLVQRSVRVKF